MNNKHSGMQNWHRAQSVCRWLLTQQSLRLLKEKISILLVVSSHDQWSYWSRRDLLPAPVPHLRLPTPCSLARIYGATHIRTPWYIQREKLLTRHAPLPDILRILSFLSVIGALIRYAWQLLWRKLSPHDFPHRKIIFLI